MRGTEKITVVAKATYLLRTKFGNFSRSVTLCPSLPGINSRCHSASSLISITSFPSFGAFIHRPV